GGRHANGRETHGHSMVVDPWGRIVAERAAGPGVVMADIDPAVQAKLRKSLPALTHRVL
ncbi:MAG: carbon-nitrogen hydrolase family protein, partial [Betaproteobacteria bacterium]